MPVAALGVLHFMEMVLSKMEFYRSTSSLVAIPVFLKFLNHIAVKHSQMVTPRATQVLILAMHCTSK